MAKQNSFDIVSEVDLAEVKNAVNQATKEIRQRYDLKNSESEIDFDEKAPALVLHSADEYTVQAVKGVLEVGLDIVVGEHLGERLRVDVRLNAFEVRNERGVEMGVVQRQALVDAAQAGLEKAEVA